MAAISEFPRFWGAQSAVFLGFQFAWVSLPLIAAVQLGATPAQLGMLTSAFFSSNFLLGLIAGVIADRLRQIPVLRATSAVSAGCAAWVLLGAEGGWLTIDGLIVASFILGASAMQSDAAAASLLPVLVERERLGEANGKLRLSLALAQLLGPAAGGVLLERMGPAGSLLPALTCFGLGALGRLYLVGSPRPLVPARPTIWLEIRHGFAFLVGSGTVRPLVIFTAMSGGFAAATIAIYPLYGLELGLAVAAIGMTLAASGLGGVLGSASVAFGARRIRTGPLLIWSAVLLCVGLWLTPLASVWLHWALPLLVASKLVTGFMLGVYSSQTTGLQQAQTPPEMQGRVFASIRIARYGSLALGAAMGGWLASWMGLGPSTAVAAAGSSLALLALALGRVWEMGKDLDGHPSARLLQEMPGRPMV